MNQNELEEKNKILNLIIGFGLFVIFMTPFLAYADQVQCDVFSKNAGMKHPIFVRVYVNEFYTYGEYYNYPNADEEQTLYASKQRMAYMEQSCHDDFYKPQCDDFQCSFGLVRK